MSQPYMRPVMLRALREPGTIRDLAHRLRTSYWSAEHLVQRHRAHLVVVGERRPHTGRPAKVYRAAAA